MSIKKYKKVVLALTIFILCVTSFSIAYAGVEQHPKYIKKHKVLVINSYHFDETWEASIFAGIKKTLNNEFKNIEYNFEYLDSKKSILNFNELEKNFLIKFRKQKYDLIIACDDEALEFLNKVYEKIFNNTPVVYTSINNENISISKELEKNSVGLLEKQAIENTIALVNKIQKNIKTYNFLFDNTTTANIFVEEVQEIKSKYPNIIFNIIQEDKIEDVIEKIQGTEKDGALFLYGVYQDANGQIIDRNTISEAFESSIKMPIYTWIEPYFTQSVIGGAILEGGKIGELTATLCYRILNGESIETIENVTNNNFNYDFNYNQLQKFKIKRRDLPKNYKMFNHPSPLRQIPLEVKLITILIIVILVFIVIMLFIQITYRNKMYKQALEYENLRTEFFSNISHELRTPLNIILSTLQLNDRYIESGDVVYKNEIVSSRMDALKQNSMRLLKLINNLIDITKIDAGYFKIQEENLNIIEVIENITMSAANYVERKNITLVFDTEIEERFMSFDKDKIERVMLNLLSNSIKFTPKGGYIYVDIYDGKDEIKITVRDTGVGIPKNKQQIIFERFRQVDNLMTRNQEGSGIGLSLSKSLVEMHGGTLKVESEVNKGSTFIIKLPIKSSDENNNYSKMILDDSAEKLTIEFSDIYKE